MAEYSLFADSISDFSELKRSALASVTPTPVIRFLLFQAGVITKDNLLSHAIEYLDSPNHEVPLQPTESVIHACSDPRFFVRYFMGTKGGEMALRDSPGAVYEETTGQNNFNRILVDGKIDSIKEMAVIGHKDCGQMSEFIDNPSSTGNYKISSLIANYKKEFGSDEQVRLYLSSKLAEIYAVKTMLQYLERRSVEDAIDREQLSVVVGKFDFEEITPTKIIGLCTTILNPETARFERPSSKDEIEKLWATKFDGKSRSSAIKAILNRAKADMFKDISSRQH